MEYGDCKGINGGPWGTTVLCWEFLSCCHPDPKALSTPTQNLLQHPRCLPHAAVHGGGHQPNSAINTCPGTVITCFELVESQLKRNKDSGFDAQ